MCLHTVQCAYGYIAGLLTKPASDFNTALTGFEPPEMEQLFNKVASKEVKEDDFDVDEELKNPTFSKAGDLWLLGRHTVFCGDSTDPASYEKLMDGVKANVIVTDPPYNVNDFSIAVIEYVHKRFSNKIRLICDGGAMDSFDGRIKIYSFAGHS